MANNIMTFEEWLKYQEACFIVSNIIIIEKTFMDGYIININ